MPQPNARPSQPAQPEKMGLLDYFERIYWPRKLGHSPRTATLYRLTFSRLGEFLGACCPLLSDLTDENVCGFLSARLAAGLAQHTVDKERDKLLAVAAFAARKRHLAEFLDVPTIRPADCVPQCWKREHLSALLEASATMPGRVGLASAGLWWVAFNLVALFTGERTGALLELRWSWLDGVCLRVPANVRKGGRVPMMYRLPSVVLVALDRLRVEAQCAPDGLIFATHWARAYKSGTFYRHYGKLLRAAGLPDGRQFKPQCLRRTFASFLEYAGGDATAALAHSDRRTTVKSYLDPTVSRAGEVSASSLVAGVLQF